MKIFGGIRGKFIPIFRQSLESLIFVLFFFVASRSCLSMQFRSIVRLFTCDYRIIFLCFPSTNREIRSRVFIFFVLGVATRKTRQTVRINNESATNLSTKSTLIPHIIHDHWRRKLLNYSIENLDYYLKNSARKLYKYFVNSNRKRICNQKSAIPSPPSTPWRPFEAVVVRVGERRGEAKISGVPRLGWRPTSAKCNLREELQQIMNL